MINGFYRLLDKKMLILLVIMLLISPTLCGKNTYTICLVYSHYLTVYLNNVYLLTVYQYCYRLNALSSYMITRLKDDAFYTQSYLAIVLFGIFYTLIIYISYYFFFGAILSEDLPVTFIFMVLNLVITGFESTIIFLQIGQKKNFLYLVLPILINFIFHIIFTKLF